MKNNGNTFLKTLKTITLIFALACTTNISAQFGPPPGPPPPPGLENDNTSGDSIPLDGGLTILIVGAAAYGIKKLRKNKNHEI